MELVYAVAAVLISAALSLGALKLRCLTKDGAAMSIFVGSFVGVFSTFEAFVLLIIFTVAGFVATKKSFDKKSAAGLQEGKKGERTWKNVLGVGLPPMAVVAVYALGLLSLEEFAVMFVTTMTVAGADTIASELGVRDEKVYLITTFERVERGTNGGVSAFGTLVSTAAAFLIALFGWWIVAGGFDWLFLIPFAMGVVGNLLDSVFGAVLENPGYITKYANNCSTALIGAVLGLAVYLLVRLSNLYISVRDGRTRYDGHSGGETPGPFPNPEVKSARVSVCTVLRKRTGTQTRCQPLFPSTPSARALQKPA